MALKIMKLYRFTALNSCPYSSHQEELQFSTNDAAITYAKSLLSDYGYVITHKFVSMDSCDVIAPIAKLEIGFDIEYYPDYFD